MLTPNDAVKYKDTFGSKIWRLTNLYKIRNKKAQLACLKPNNIQRRILSKILPGYKAKRPIRHFDLKYRQGGVSTFWLLWHLDETIFHDNTTTGILADKWENLGHLWRIIKTAFDEMPERLKPKIIKSNESLLAFDTRSEILVSLSIRATTLHNLHVSEYAYCEPEEIVRTFAAATPDANISMETTGNGMNHGRDKFLSMLADERALFHPWFLQEEYQDHENGAVITLTRSEENLKKRAKSFYGISLAASQILFRRRMQAELGFIFSQEMAEDQDSCFIGTGNPFFDGHKIQALLLRAEELSREKGLPIEHTEDYDIWEQPQPGHHYAAGADVAEGKESSPGDSASRDYSVLAIINATTKRTAFRYRARVGVDAFYRICDKWGRHYNNALLAVEKNNHGLAVILGLREDCHYPKLYGSDDFSRAVSIGPGKINKTIQNTGWETNRENRTQMLDKIKLALEGKFEEDAAHFIPAFEVLDTLLLREASFIIFNNAGKIEAASGKHDDLVMAYAIAYEMLLLIGRRSLAFAPGAIIVGEQSESSRLFGPT